MFMKTLLRWCDNRSLAGQRSEQSWIAKSYDSLLFFIFSNLFSYENYKWKQIAISRWRKIKRTEIPCGVYVRPSVCLGPTRRVTFESTRPHFTRRRTLWSRESARQRLYGGEDSCERKGKNYIPSLIHIHIYTYIRIVHWSHRRLCGNQSKYILHYFSLSLSLYNSIDPFIFICEG